MQTEEIYFDVSFTLSSGPWDRVDKKRYLVFTIYLTDLTNKSYKYLLTNYYKFVKSKDKVVVAKEQDSDDEQIDKV